MTGFDQSNYMVGQHANFWRSIEFDNDRAYERPPGTMEKSDDKKNK
jgi:hypothetical protein